MAESQIHMMFVRRIVDYISTSADLACVKEFIQADLPEFGQRTPQVIGGYYPDVFYSDSSIIIIGEAKTVDDIDNKHTEAQLMSYIEEVSSYSKSKHIVVCSSLYAFAFLKNKLTRLKNQHALDDITFHVIDNLSKVAII